MLALLYMHHLEIHLLSPLLYSKTENKKHKIVIVEAEKPLNIEFHNSREKKGHIISKISAESHLANKLGDCIIGLNDKDVTGLASKKLVV